jgi:N-sulfoglucosamine sulfohydrolase
MHRLKLLCDVTLVLTVSSSPILSGNSHAASDQPNILWIYQEDTSPWMACYGHEIQQGWTPRVDQLAEEGVRFSRAFVPFPVCSACRSSLIVGANAIRFGAHEHRSRRGKLVKPLPEGMRTIPDLMREQGYFPFNVGKTDYNFFEQGLYPIIPKQHVQKPWRAVPKGKPFFGQIQLKGGKTNTTKWPVAKRTDPASVTIPADYPQTDLYREVVAQHYDTIRSDDEVIGRILDDLAADELLEKTIVVYFSDHGANNLVRHKQMPTEGGLHVPFIIRFPKRWRPVASGSVRNDLVSMLDLSATTLAWAGIAKPEWFEGNDLFADDFQPRPFVASAKDRLDHTIDRVRSIRTERYRYTRNYFLDRVLLQPQYRDGRPFTKALRAAYADGSLAPVLKQIYFGERPAEELYDVVEDPAQVHNLAGDPAYGDVLTQHRALLETWLAKGDLGKVAEPADELRANGENAKWGTGVNAEYENIRIDSDGDGLSDTWETVNGRDPQDGRLVFEFDCGGWQTEGWQSTDITDNLAGYQGFLDFHLDGKKGSLHRDGLSTKATSSDQAIVVRLRCTREATVGLLVNRRASSEQCRVPAGKQWHLCRFPLSGFVPVGEVFRELTLTLTGDDQAFFEIDSIMVDRN